MNKVAIIVNIPSPYRVDFFCYLQNNYPEFEFSIIYTSSMESNREWQVDEGNLKNSYFLKSKTIEKKSDLDTHIVHIPKGIIRILNKLKPNVVVAAEYNVAAIEALTWCKLHKKPYISWTDGTLYSERNIGAIQKMSRRLIISQASSCIASSSKAKEKCEEWGANIENIFVSLLSVDLNQWLGAVHAPVKGRILYVGSFIRRKGVDLLLNAINHISGSYELHIVGNGNSDEINGLIQQAKSLGIEENIIIKSFLQGTDLIREYSEAEIFVLPTREDCFGLVLLEAAALGVPIVSSKFADGAVDVVEPCADSMIIDPEHEIEFAAAIDKLRCDEKLRKRYGEELKNMVRDKFLFSSTSLGYVNAIRSVLNT